MDNLSRSIAAAEEEFAKLKEKEEFVCHRYNPPVICDWQMRQPKKWRGRQRQKDDDNNKPVYYCFALSYRLWDEKDEYLSDSSDDKEPPKFIIKIFILVPQHCSIYHFANFIASSKTITCVAANSKIYLFGGDCGTHVLYRDVVVVVEVAAAGGADEWKQAKACFNREKRKPLSFSLGNRIYALETHYLQTSHWDEESYNDDDDCWFEVLDTSSSSTDDDDDSCWVPLRNPPFPFGACKVVGSWTSDGSDGYHIFIDTVSSLRALSGAYLFVYDVHTDTWDKFKRYYTHHLVHHPSIYLDYRPFYPWALHSIGKDFAPFPPHEPYTGDLRVLTGLKHSIPQLQQLASECQRGLSLPFSVKVETDRKEKVIVPCKNSSRCLTGLDLESLWTLHCLPVEKLIFWQAIHLGGSSFCTLAYYIPSHCCSQHGNMYVRVANFDITNAAADGASETVFSAQYGANKVYSLSKAVLVSLLPCSKL